VSNLLEINDLVFYNVLNSKLYQMERQQKKIKDYEMLALCVVLDIDDIEVKKDFIKNLKLQKFC